MDKLKTKILLISLMLILLLSLQSAAAASADENLTSEIDLSICDNEGNVGSHSMLSAVNSEDLLGEGEGSFGELQNLIDSHYNAELTLIKSYKCNGESGIHISGPITIYGNGHTLNGNHEVRILNVMHSDVVIHDIIFINGNAEYGGAMQYGTAINCTFNNNTANQGGAIYNGTAENCTFTHNTANEFGGGAISNGTAVNCTFTNNTAIFGGAIYYGNAENCTFTHNTADDYGGAIYKGNAENCTFTHNTAKYGGAISNGDAENCTFNNNTADGGGAITAGDAKNCTFTHNTADNFGGAIFYGNAENCTFNNNAAKYGGAISNGDAENCTFTNNTAADGGAIYGYNLAKNSVFKDNHLKNGENNDLNLASSENCMFISTNTTEGDDFGYSEGVVFETETAIPENIERPVIIFNKENEIINDATININGKKVTVNGLNNPDNYEICYYTNTINEQGDKNYNRLKIAVKAKSSVWAEDVSVLYGDSINIPVTSINATNITYRITNNKGEDVANGTIEPNTTISLSGLATGKYIVNLTTGVDKNHSSTSNASKITVNPAGSSVRTEDVNVIYGETIEIIVSCENATHISYQIINQDEILKEGTINAGENITGLDLAVGEYSVNLTTQVNENHTTNNYTSKITVKPATSSISAEDVNVNYGETVSIPVTSTNASEVYYEIMNAANEVVANGTIGSEEAITISGLDAGDYTIKLTTLTDENHTNASGSSKLHVKHVVTIVIDAVFGYTGEVVNLTAEFKYENGDPVNEGVASLSIRYDEKLLLAFTTYSVLDADDSNTYQVSDGKVVFEVKLGAPGTYPYIVTYSSDSDDVQAESTVTISKLNTSVSGDDISGNPGDERDITVAVLDQNSKPVKNGTVTLNLNGETYNATVENGQATFNVELPSPGTYNSSIIYNGNDYYASSSESLIAVNVEKENTNLPSAKDISGKAGEKIDITVEIRDENGNPVKNGTATLTIDSKTYTTEVVDGVATFKDVVLPENDTVADVYYQGNDYYNSSSATFSIKINKDNNNTLPDNGTDENKSEQISHETVDARNATGNPIVVLMMALFALVITCRKKIKH